MRRRNRPAILKISDFPYRPFVPNEFSSDADERAARIWVCKPTGMVTFREVSMRTVHRVFWTLPDNLEPRTTGQRCQPRAVFELTLHLPELLFLF